MLEENKEELLRFYDDFLDSLSHIERHFDSETLGKISSENNGNISNKKSSFLEFLQKTPYYNYDELGADEYIYSPDFEVKTEVINCNEAQNSLENAIFKMEIQEAFYLASESYDTETTKLAVAIRKLLNPDGTYTFLYSEIPIDLIEHNKEIEKVKAEFSSKNKRNPNDDEMKQVKLQAFRNQCGAFYPKTENPTYKEYGYNANVFRFIKENGTLIKEWNPYKKALEKKYGTELLDEYWDYKVSEFDNRILDEEKKPIALKEQRERENPSKTYVKKD